MTATGRPDGAEIVVHVDFAPGNLGNKMLQYLAAARLADRLGGARLSGVAIPEFGIDLPTIPKGRARTLRYVSKVSARLDAGDVARRVAEGGVERVELNLYSSCLGNLPPLERARALFPLDEGAEGYGADVLLVNVRAAEILQAVHRDYTVLPVEFYADLVAATGLRPVFLGQLGGESRYLARLREAFPRAEFVPSRGALRDLSTIAGSRNVVMAVSTFSWLAGWLSRADRVVMPLSGFLNPEQYPAVDLIPADDPRMEFHLFPPNHAARDEDIEAAHRALVGRWRELPPEEARALAAAHRLPPLGPDTWSKALRREGRDRLGRLVGSRRRWLGALGLGARAPRG